MNDAFFHHAHSPHFERKMDDYPEITHRADDDDEEDGNDEDDICHDGYRLDEGFGSWEEVNRMFV